MYEKREMPVSKRRQTDPSEEKITLHENLPSQNLYALPSSRYSFLKANLKRGGKRGVHNKIKDLQSQQGDYIYGEDSELQRTPQKVIFMERGTIQINNNQLKYNSLIQTHSQQKEKQTT